MRYARPINYSMQLFYPIIYPMQDQWIINTILINILLNLHCIWCYSKKWFYISTLKDKLTVYIENIHVIKIIKWSKYNT